MLLFFLPEQLIGFEYFADEHNNSEYQKIAGPYPSYMAIIWMAVKKHISADMKLWVLSKLKSCLNEQISI